MEKTVLVFGKVDFTEPSRPFDIIGVFDSYIKLMKFYREMRFEVLNKVDSNENEIYDRIDHEFNSILNIGSHYDEETDHDFQLRKMELNKPLKR